MCCAGAAHEGQLRWQLCSDEGWFLRDRAKQNGICEKGVGSKSLTQSRAVNVLRSYVGLGLIHASREFGA